MTVAVISVETLDEGENWLRCVALDEDSDWRTDLAEEYLRLRTECVVPITEDVLEGLDGFSIADIQKRISQRTVPAYHPGNLNVVRSDFGEVMCYRLLEE